MTNDDAARAQHLWESLKCDEDPVPLIAAALDEARREGQREVITRDQGLWRTVAAHRQQEVTALKQEIYEKQDVRLLKELRQRNALVADLTAKCETLAHTLSVANSTIDNLKHRLAEAHRSKL